MTRALHTAGTTSSGQYSRELAHTGGAALADQFGVTGGCTSLNLADECVQIIVIQTQAVCERHGLKAGLMKAVLTKDVVCGEGGQMVDSALVDPP